MNEMLKLMHDRRSTRAYRPEPLQEAVIQQILEAGRFAPSGMNKQLNHFYVITDPNYLADPERCNLSWHRHEYLSHC